jgi:1-acyl-sn-glycerol-3-phosphate acyltransferase
MIRAFLYWTGGVILTMIFAVIFYLLVPFYRKYPGLPHVIIRIWSKVIVRVFYGCKISLYGEEFIDSSLNYIIVSNHRSYTDILFAGAAVPLQFRWLAKRSLFRIPVIGAAMRIAGYISVERTKYKSASRSLRQVKAVLEKGTSSIWIFPEGTRTPKDALGVFKRGAFILARETGKPLLPVVLVNTDKLFVRPWAIKPKDVKVIVKPPIRCDDFRTAHIDDREIEHKIIMYLRSLLQEEYDAHVTKPS